MAQEPVLVLALLLAFLLAAVLRTLPKRGRRDPAREGLTLLLLTRDAAQGLEGSLRAAHRILQSWPGPTQMIAVDQGSTDDTLAILRRWQQRHPGFHCLSAEAWAGFSSLEAGYFLARHPLFLVLTLRQGDPRSQLQGVVTLLDSLRRQRSLDEPGGGWDDASEPPGRQLAALPAPGRGRPR